jgi:protein-tyrosine-phosphatase
MSEALFERAAGGVHEARSAGTSPADHVHAYVVDVMREEGIDLSNRKPQPLTTDLAQWADIVITMGCGDACPVIPGKRYVDWDLPDPSGLPLERVREIRDDISLRVGLLLESLDRNSS